MISWLTVYDFGYERTLSYMLQASEYSIVDFWKWWKTTKDFRHVSERGSLVQTAFGKLLYEFAVGVSLSLLAASGFMVGLSILHGNVFWLVAGAAMFMVRPFVVTLFAVIAVFVGNKWYIQPRLAQKIADATQIFANHPGKKVAVLGSYGKTTMKELLATALSEGLEAAATPATKNVAVSHAAFARSLTGEEAVVILEFGEGRPGDTKLFTDMFKPDYAVVTGLAPAHLDAYGSVSAVAEDFAYITQSVQSDHIFINGSDELLTEHFPGAVRYSEQGVGSWKTSATEVSAEGLTYTLANKTAKIVVHSKLLGRHQVGPLSIVAILGMELGLKKTQIAKGLAQTVPYEHRMQPRNINGALLIDDTYNGNIEGIKAGIALLKELPARRKIYVTPGLVEQGEETENVHTQIGALLAEAKFDEIVLMDNSYTKIIKTSLDALGYAGSVKIETNPLEYYQNIEYHIAAGDVIMMQNDLPDRYQ